VTLLLPLWCWFPYSTLKLCWVCLLLVTFMCPPCPGHHHPASGWQCSSCRLLHLCPAVCSQHGRLSFSLKNHNYISSLLSKSGRQNYCACHSLRAKASLHHGPKVPTWPAPSLSPLPFPSNPLPLLLLAINQHIPRPWDLLRCSSLLTTWLEPSLHPNVTFLGHTDSPLLQPP
jgi:hypothetical protein